MRPCAWCRPGSSLWSSAWTSSTPTSFWRSRRTPCESARKSWIPPCASGRPCASDGSERYLSISGRLPPQFFMRGARRWKHAHPSLSTPNHTDIRRLSPISSQSGTLSTYQTNNTAQNLRNYDFLTPTFSADGFTLPNISRKVKSSGEIYEKAS